MRCLFIPGITTAESHKTRITPHNAARTATGVASTGNTGARREQRSGSRRVPALLRGCPGGKRSEPGEPEATQPADSSRRVAFEAEGVPSPAEFLLRRHRDRQATSAVGGVVNGQDPRRAGPARVPRQPNQRRRVLRTAGRRLTTENRLARPQALPVCVGTPTWIVRRSGGVMQTSKRSNGFGRRTSTIELAVL